VVRSIYSAKTTGHEKRRKQRDSKQVKKAQKEDFGSMFQTMVVN